MRAGPKALAELPGMLEGLTSTEVEVVEPLELEYAQAVPVIARPSEAMQWLNAHHRAQPDHPARPRRARVDRRHRPRVRHLRAARLLDGETDTSGYPEYNAVVGGIASHWDEATGDMIVRGVVGWGGKGVRGDTDRIASRLLTNILGQHPREPVLAGPHRGRPAGAGRWPRRASSAPIAGSRPATSARSTAPSAACACSAADAHPTTARCPSTSTSAPPATTAPTSSTGSTIRARPFCPSCGREGTMRKQFVAPTIHFKGSGWAKKDRGSSAFGVEDRVEGLGRRGQGRRQRRRVKDGKGSGSGSGSSGSSDGLRSGSGSASVRLRLGSTGGSGSCDGASSSKPSSSDRSSGSGD